MSAKRETSRIELQADALRKIGRALDGFTPEEMKRILDHALFILVPQIPGQSEEKSS